VTNSLPSAVADPAALATGPQHDPRSDPVRRIAAQLAQAAHAIDRLRGGPENANKPQRGDLAQLRRMRSDAARIPPEVFWRVLPNSVPRDEETFWLDVLPLMAKHPHQRGQRLGHLLREAWSGDPQEVRGGLRLERWLRLPQFKALRETDRLLQRLDKSQGLDWVGFGLLLFRWDDPDDGERRRRDLARDFFRGRFPSAPSQPTEREND
jgi:CRISPR type I-E-associated protein CasB/Cse2